MNTKDYFQSFNLFSENEIDAFLQLFEVRKVNKNEYFVQEGERCKEVAFIKSGFSVLFILLMTEKI